MRRIGADTAAKYFVVVPASPIETGVAATHGPLDLAEATRQAAQQRLDYTLTTLRSDNLDADGALGDYRPLRALANAVESFHPDQIVIATLPPEYSVWHRFDVVDRARAEYDVPVTHVVATPVAVAQSAPMTIIAGISASRQGTAPLNLAAQIARCTGDKIVAAAIMERPWPPRDDPVEEEYLRYVTSQAGSHSTDGRPAAGRSRHPHGRRAPINLCPNRFD